MFELSQNVRAFTHSRRYNPSIKVTVLTNGLKGNDATLAVISRQAGHSTKAVGCFAVEQFKSQLRKDVLRQRPFVRVKASHGLDKPGSKLLVHIVIIQLRRFHQRAVLPDYGVDAPQMFLHDSVTLSD